MSINKILIEQGRGNAGGGRGNAGGGRGETNTPQKQEPVVKKQETVKAPEPVRKQVNVSDLDPQYQPNVQYIIPNKNTSNVQPNQPNKAPDKVTFTRITNPNDD